MIRTVGVMISVSGGDQCQTEIIISVSDGDYGMITALTCAANADIVHGHATSAITLRTGRDIMRYAAI